MVSVQVPEYKIADKVTLDSSKTAVIVVDMQNDFVHPKGALFVPEAEKTIPVIKKLLEEARKKNVLIIYTADSHMKKDIEFDIWGKHAIEGTWGWEIHEDLKPQEDDIIIRKLRYDAFFGTPLGHLLRINKIENIVIAGTVANICVLHLAGSAALRGYKVYLVIDGVSALNEFDKHATFRQVDFLYKGTLVKSENLEFS